MSCDWRCPECGWHSKHSDHNENCPLKPDSLPIDQWWKENMEKPMTTPANPVSQEQSFEEWWSETGCKAMTLGRGNALHAWKNRTIHYQKELAEKDAEILKVQQNYNLLYGIHQEVETRGKQRIAELEAQLDKDKENRALISGVADEIREDIRTGKRDKIDISPLPEPPTGEDNG